MPCTAPHCAARWATVAAARGALALAGCGDPTAPLTPADVTGTYVLASKGGVVPPIPFGTGTTIVADTITFRTDSTWQSVEASGDIGAGLEPKRVRRFNGNWQLDSRRPVLYARYTNQGSLFESAYAVRDAGRALEYSEPGGVWRYVRVP